MANSTVSLVPSASEASPRNPGFQDRPNLAADELNVLLETHLPAGVQWTVSQVKWMFHFTDLTVEVRSEVPGGIIVVANSDALPRKSLDPLRQELRSVLNSALAGPTWSTFGFGVMLLQLAEEAIWHLEDFKDENNRVKEQGYKHRRTQGWDAASEPQFSDILKNNHGVDLLTVNDPAKEILGKPISNILAELPEGHRVLHVEPVFRADLVARFLARRQEMKEELMQLSKEQLQACVNHSAVGRTVYNSVEALADYLTRTHVTFHGSRRENIPSIVRYGFLKPGETLGHGDSKVKAAFFNAWYGVGVYSSPSLEFATWYGKWNQGTRGKLQSSYRDAADVPGVRIIVCATLMGLSLEVSREATQNTLTVNKETAHSHVSPNGMEYVVFDSTQIIPCYVLHVDYGAADATACHGRLLKDSLEEKANAHRARFDTGFDEEDANCKAAKIAEKAVLKASAMKYLPFGFGSATGTNFVVEDMADTDDDDEEEDGMSQSLRSHHGDLASLQHRSADEKSSWFDQYQTARLTSRSVSRDDGGW